ncbi:hypothetical protein Cgig2_022046 [Carnegiea gigantea]|uniref:Vps72/YL1 C-terminal domain-containing protein n=1 Tax=Carnegiea gigantea TaxID=171969 RepID=A0A9Q1KRU8_9CARY|nr:hypothetical protein Cgig2_022046 [Carnegiea gigantea]
MEREVVEAELVLPTHFNFKKIQTYEKYPKGQSRSRHWKHLKQILQAENYQNYPPDQPNYVNIESPPSMHPPKRICDITGYENWSSDYNSLPSPFSWGSHHDQCERDIHLKANSQLKLVIAEKQWWLQKAVARYHDPRTNMRYANAEVFKLIRSLPNEYVQRYLALRNAAVVLRWFSCALRAASEQQNWLICLAKYEDWDKRSLQHQCVFATPGGGGAMPQPFVLGERVENILKAVEGFYCSRSELPSFTSTKRPPSPLEIRRPYKAREIPAAASCTGFRSCCTGERVTFCPKTSTLSGRSKRDLISGGLKLKANDNSKRICVIRISTPDNEVYNVSEIRIDHNCGSINDVFETGNKSLMQAFQATSDLGGLGSNFGRSPKPKIGAINGINQSSLQIPIVSPRWRSSVAGDPGPLILNLADRRVGCGEASELGFGHGYGFGFLAPFVGDGGCGLPFGAAAVRGGSEGSGRMARIGETRVLWVVENGSSGE